jgi:hypothetical protein
MKEYTFEIVLIIVLLILWTLVLYPNYEAIKQYLVRSLDQPYDQSSQEEFKSAYIKSCHDGAIINNQKDLGRELDSDEMEQIKKACECMIKAGEKEGIFEKNSLEVTNFYTALENMKNLISKYECMS